MADDSSLHDALPPALQAAVDKRMTGEEVALMSLRGASGEAIVVTDRQVMILREQMPIVGSKTEVDGFVYSYSQIRDVLVEEAVGGGHLKIVLFTPPPDEHYITLFFPSYDLGRFEAAAARIRLLAEQTRDHAVDIPAATGGHSVWGLPCPACGGEVPQNELFCRVCGAPQGAVCRWCHKRIPPKARFCPRCGVPAESARSLTCAECGQTLLPSLPYCPRCGHADGIRCVRCGMYVLEGWSRCPGCGSDPRMGGEKEQFLTAEEHNARGMSLYNQENYAEAAREFQMALALEPTNALYHCNLGVAYAEMGHQSEALAEYDVAIRLAPNDPTAYLNLGYFYAEREDKEKARQAWEKAICVAPNSPEADEARQNLAEMDKL